VLKLSWGQTERWGQFILCKGC